MVHARQIDGRTLDFGVSGKLWRNSLVMQDRQTGSLWSHVTGEALAGELAGAELEILPAVQTTWSAWRQQHPDTEVLRKEGEVRSSRYAEYFADPDRTGLFRTRWLRERLPGKTLVYGLRHGPHAVAVTPDALRGGTPREVTLGDLTVTVARTDDGGARAWSTGPDGERRARDVLEVFWFAWSSFFPSTRVID